MGHMSYACRNFYHISEGKKWFIGYIDLFIIETQTKYGRFEILIEGLQDNGYYLDDGQAAVVVEYPKIAPLYDVIMTIFNKITKDHEYKLKNIKYNDFIICSNELSKKHPEKCNYDRKETYVGGDWMLITKESVQYVDCLKEGFIERENDDNSNNDDDDYINPENNNNIIRGKVEYNQNNELEFTYDYPIISRDMPKEYYDLTRNRIVWDVQQDEETEKYYIKPYCFADINEEP